MTKDIIILAKSTKHYPSYCIAGIDVNSGEWVRPISDDAEREGAVPPDDVVYEDGSEVNVLDIVRISFIQAFPSNAQPENILYDNTIYWEKIGETTIEEVAMNFGLDNRDFIFSNTKKDLVEDELPRASLMLVKIQNPYIVVKTFEKKKIQICFDYNNRHYDYIRVEDTDIVEEYNRYNDGTYYLPNELYAVFSLTDKYYITDKYYKMLAKLFL